MNNLLDKQVYIKENKIVKWIKLLSEIKINLYISILTKILLFNFFKN